MSRRAPQEVRIAIVYLAPDQSLTRIYLLTGPALFAHVELVSIAGLTCSDTGLQSEFRIEKRLPKF